MKLTCDQATQICDKSQYNEAALWEKVTLSIHLLLCKKCGLYSKQNNILTKCYEKHKQIEASPISSLCEEEKKTMHKKLKAKI